MDSALYRSWDVWFGAKCLQDIYICLQLICHKTSNTQKNAPGHLRPADHTYPFTKAVLFSDKTAVL
ncbi:hypothetical protein TMatcc_003878 [Talaromyces marneffei ATCC 18224]